MKKEFMSIKEIREVPDNLIQKLKIPVYHEEDEHKTSMKPKKERMTLSKLAVEMQEGFNKVNARIDHLETRIDRIEKRLDYNNLKPLPQNK